MSQKSSRPLWHGLLPTLAWGIPPWGNPPWGNPPWGIPPRGDPPMGGSSMGDAPQGGSPMGGFPMGNPQWGIPHGDPPWGIPHGDSPIGYSPQGVPPWECPNVQTSWGMSRDRKSEKESLAPPQLPPDYGFLTNKTLLQGSSSSTCPAGPGRRADYYTRPPTTGPSPQQEDGSQKQLDGILDEYWTKSKEKDKIFTNQKEKYTFLHKSNKKYTFLKKNVPARKTATSGKMNIFGNVQNWSGTIGNGPESVRDL